MEARVMRLKDILLENKSEAEKAVDLDIILNRGKFKNDMETLFYRGEESKEVEYFEVRSIRKDRKPKDTPTAVQKLVDLIGRYQYPDVPKRSESKYAASSISEAQAYGDVRVVFSEENVNIVSFDADTFNYLPTEKGFRACTHFLDEDISEVPESDLIFAFRSDLNTNDLVKKFVVGCAYLYKEGVVNRLLSGVLKGVGLDTLISSFKNFKKYLKGRSDNTGKYRGDNVTFAKIIIKMLEDIDKYYNEKLRKNSFSDSNEIMFDGEEYLVVDLDFFEEYFHYMNGKWQAISHKVR